MLRRTRNTTGGGVFIRRKLTGTVAAEDVQVIEFVEKTAEMQSAIRRDEDDRKSASLRLV